MAKNTNKYKVIETHPDEGPTFDELRKDIIRWVEELLQFGKMMEIKEGKVERLDDNNK